MKNYVQPNIQVTELVLLTVVCGSITIGITDKEIGSDSGMAPLRQFNGSTQGLKYLI